MQYVESLLWPDAKITAEEAARLADTLKNINAQADYDMLIQTLIKAADVSYPVVDAAE